MSLVFFASTFFWLFQKMNQNKKLRRLLPAGCVSKVATSAQLATNWMCTLILARLMFGQYCTLFALCEALSVKPNITKKYTFVNLHFSYCALFYVHRSKWVYFLNLQLVFFFILSRRHRLWPVLRTYRLNKRTSSYSTR